MYHHSSRLLVIIHTHTYAHTRTHYRVALTKAERVHVCWTCAYTWCASLNITELIIKPLRHVVTIGLLKLKKDWGKMCNSESVLCDGHSFRLVKYKALYIMSPKVSKLCSNFKLHGQISIICGSKMQNSFKHHAHFHFRSIFIFY